MSQSSLHTLTSQERAERLTDDWLDRYSDGKWLSTFLVIHDSLSPAVAHLLWQIILEASSFYRTWSCHFLACARSLHRFTCNGFTPGGWWEFVFSVRLASFLLPKEWGFSCLIIFRSSMNRDNLTQGNKQRPLISQPSATWQLARERGYQK